MSCNAFALVCSNVCKRIVLMLLDSVDSFKAQDARPWHFWLSIR